MLTLLSTKSILITLILLTTIEYSSSQELGTDNDVIRITSPILKGSLVDSYEKKLIIIKIKSPQDVIKDVISRIDLKAMNSGTANELLKTLGGIETHYQNQFKEILSTHQELLATPYPIEEEKTGNGQLLDIKGLRRSKRSCWRTLIAFLRAVRPVARNAGKLTKYGKFMKGLKYTGYAVSAGVFAYEMADIFGAIPDIKYEEVTRQLNSIHESRIKDLEIIRNITLLTMNTNQNIKDIGSEVSLILSEAKDRFEIMIKVSQAFGSYMQQLSNGFLLLLQGKIPSNIISLDLQRSWLENQLPGPLLNHIGSITPHLRVNIKAIDEVNSQIIISVEIPQVDSKFQMLNYVYWEPKVIHSGICYTSPRSSLFLAYPPSVTERNIPLKPILIDPESCLTDGYIMCESDSILDQIPLLSENRICTNTLNQRITNKYKRSVEDLFFQATSPVYDISRIVNKTLERDISVETTQIDLSKLKSEIDSIIKRAKDEAKESKRLLEIAERDSLLIKILFLILTPIIFFILWKLIIFIKTYLTIKKERKIEDRRLKILEQINEIESN